MEVQWRTPLQCLFFLWATPTFHNNICLLLLHREPHHLFCVGICMQQSPFTACPKPRSLIHCCCRTAGVIPLQHFREYYSAEHVQQHWDICLLSYVCIAWYLQHVVNTISEHISWFYQSESNRIWSRLLSGSAVMTWFQRWSIWEHLDLNKSSAAL